MTIPAAPVLEVGNTTKPQTIRTIGDEGLLCDKAHRLTLLVTTGLAAVGVQVGAGWLLFREPMAPTHRLGTLLVGRG